MAVHSPSQEEAAVHSPSQEEAAVRSPRQGKAAWDPPEELPCASVSGDRGSRYSIGTRL